MKSYAILALSSAFITAATAQSIRPVDRSSYIATRSQSTPRSALVDPQDKIFPQLMFGDGWETVVVVVNIGGTNVHYNQLFFDADGNPLPVTFRTIPEGKIVQATATDAIYPPERVSTFRCSTMVVICGGAGPC